MYKTLKGTKFETNWWW